MLNLILGDTNKVLGFLEGSITLVYSQLGEVKMPRNFSNPGLFKFAKKTFIDAIVARSAIT